VYGKTVTISKLRLGKLYSFSPKLYAEGFKPSNQSIHTDVFKQGFVVTYKAEV